jgi:type IV pilus assembly protein PilY1
MPVVSIENTSQRSCIGRSGRHAAKIFCCALVAFVSSHSASKEDQAVGSLEISTACSAGRSTASVARSVGVEPALIFQAEGDRASRTGELRGFTMDASGRAAPSWEASAVLPPADERQLVTVNTNGAPIPLRWSALDSERRAQLEGNPRLLAYLRGDTSDEDSAFRERVKDGRPHRLGDIARSAPVFVGAPSFRYRDDLEGKPYSAFARSYAERAQLVYVGGNDGFLHAFDARTGVERLAFAPGSVFPRLYRLALSDDYQSYVDGSPSVGDAYVADAWRTVLVGALGGGGRGLYALDITDPRSFSESNAQDLVLWEFTESDDEDLGLAYSQPVIARLPTGQWAAIFGNGYPEAALQPGASAGSAVLYIVDLSTGRTIRKLKTPDAVGGPEIAWSNGLSTPAAVDADGDRIVDAVYAGDLHGNLWKFDVAGNDSAEWKVALNGQPLFRARSASGAVQPIATRPEVGRAPRGIGVTVLFGAGAPDWIPWFPKTSEPDSFYGVFDRGTPISDRTKLLEQSIFQQSSTAVADKAAFDARLVVGASEESAGWRLDFKPLTSSFEKVTTDPVLRDQRVIFATRTSTQSCPESAAVWLMSVPVHAGRTKEANPPLDVNADRLLNPADRIEFETGGGTAMRAFASGVSRHGGYAAIHGSVAIIEHAAEGDCLQNIYIPGGEQGPIAVAQSCHGGSTGRQSWRQLR